MVVVIGHRGAMGYEPENTLRSFRRAEELGAEAIELDVHVCKSGELVVIHDDSVDRTTNGRGKVSELSLEELKELNAGKGERIPTLREVMNAIKLPINIELKGFGTGDVTYYFTKDQRERIMVSSFDWDELLDYRYLDPTGRIGVLAEGLPKEYFSFAKKIKAVSVNPNFSVIDREFVDEAHRNNLLVYPWTVNSVMDMKKARMLNVDGIFTNYPDRARVIYEK